MPPYNYQYTSSPSDYQYHTHGSEYRRSAAYSPHYIPSLNHSSSDYSNRDAIISSLMEKLADREAEIRKLTSENSKLEGKLNHQKQMSTDEKNKIEELESAREKLNEKLVEREEDLRVASQRNNQLIRRQQELEMICSELQNAVDAREEELSAVENELKVACDHLTRAVESERHARNLDVSTLEDKMEDLLKDVGFYKVQVQEAKAVQHHLANREDELKSLLKENTLLLEQQEEVINMLSKKNRGLEHDVELQISMLEEQEQDVANLKQMLVKLNNVIKSQDVDLTHKDHAIQQMLRDIERYEDIVEEAEHVTWEQRRRIKAESQHVQDMSKEMEQLKDELKWERAGVLSYFGCKKKDSTAKA